MINSNKHIINTVFLEINTNSKEKGYYLKDHMDAFLQKELFSVLENYFNELDSKNPSQSIQLEKLNIDVAINQDLDFEDFKEQLLKNITKQVQEVFDNDETSTATYKRIKPQEKETESFFYFLETGTNTWWSTSENEFKIVDDTVFDEVLNDETFSFKWKNTVQKSNARARFIKQFDDSQIVNIIRKGILLKKNNAESNAKISSIEKIKKYIETNFSKSQLITNQRFSMWEIVVLSVLEASDFIVKQKLSALILSVFEFHKKNIFLEHKKLLQKEIENQIQNQNELQLLSDFEAVVLLIEREIEKIILKEKQTEIETFSKNEKSIIETELKNKTVRDEDVNIKSIATDSKEKTFNNQEKAIDKKEHSLEKEQDITETAITEMYLDNAGLVLIHPFLKFLFKNCKLLNEDDTINNAEVAAHLLHYTATGKEQDYENAMAFEKFLCNIPLAQPIERNIVLSEEMKNEAAAMLQAVLDNWEIMKKSSAELLRNEFLQRPGKLSINGNENHTVIIERKTQDILLDQLSWNLSIVKLAWKKRIIYVNW